MESTFNNTPHSSNTSSNNSPKRNSGASSSSFSSGSSVGSTSTGSSVGSSVSQSADKLSAKADTLVDKVKNIDVQEQISMLKDKAAPAYDYSVDYVKQNPMLAIGGAAAIGFFAGMLFSRK